MTAPSDTSGSAWLETSSEEGLLRETVARIGADFGHEYFMRKTRAEEPPTELWDAMGEKGFLGVCLPTEYGGGGLGMAAMAAVSEELSAAGCPLLSVVFSQTICGNLIAKYGNEEQKSRWLAGIASGEQKFS